jgi:anti-anti-sigma regulatory factor
MAVNASIANLMSEPERILSSGLRVQTQVCGDVFVFHCQGPLVFGDEGAVLQERVGNMLSGSPNVVVSLGEVDSGGIGVLVGLLVSARNRGGALKLVAPNRHGVMCFDAQIYTPYSSFTLATMATIHAHSQPARLPGDKQVHGQSGGTCSA